MAVLKNLRTAFINDNTMPRLFIYDHFDVIIHHEDRDASSAVNFIKQIRNNFNQLLHNHPKLPTMILIVLNNELLDNTAFAATQIPRLITWLLGEIQNMIKQRISHLPEKCVILSEPSVYVLKMLPRMQKSQDLGLFKSLRRKLNTQLPKIANKFGFGFINAYEINATTSLFFQADGKKLTPAGTVQLWDSISHTIHEIIEDRRKRCRPLVESKSAQTDDVRNLPTFQQLKQEEDAQAKKNPDKKDSTNTPSRRRLPPPPPRANYSRYHQDYDYNNYHYDRYHFNSNRKY